MLGGRAVGLTSFKITHYMYVCSSTQNMAKIKNFNMLPYQILVRDRLGETSLSCVEGLVEAWGLLHETLQGPSSCHLGLYGDGPPWGYPHAGICSCPPKNISLVVVVVVGGGRKWRGEIRVRYAYVAIVNPLPKHFTPD